MGRFNQTKRRDMVAEGLFPAWADRYGLPFLMLLFVATASVYAQDDGEAPVKGRAVFEEKGCIQCHAIFGDGGKVGPDLGKRKFYGSYLDLAGTMWNHFPRMYAAMQREHLPQVELTSEEMSQLVAYLLYMRYLGEPGNEFRGRKLLRSKRCLSCHKFGGVGGDVAPDFSTIKEYVSPLRLAEDMWNHGPRMRQTFKERKVKWPNISGEEIIDIAAAIRSYTAPTSVAAGSFSFGNPARGHQVLEEKKCLSCHAIRGQGGKVGPDFATIEFEYTVTELAGRMWNHGPQMWEAMEKSGLQVPTFERGELADVVATLYDIRLKAESGDPERGRAVFEKKKCLSCHSLQGEGAGAASDLARVEGLNSPLAMVTAMWNHAPKMREMATSKRVRWPKFKTNEMASLYAYLRTQWLTAQSGKP
jgi:cytochrome c2